MTSEVSERPHARPRALDRSRHTYFYPHPNYSSCGAKSKTQQFYNDRGKDGGRAFSRKRENTPLVCLTGSSTRDGRHSLGRLELISSRASTSFLSFEMPAASATFSMFQRWERRKFTARVKKQLRGKLLQPRRQDLDHNFWRDDTLHKFPTTISLDPEDSTKMETTTSIQY